MFRIPIGNIVWNPTKWLCLEDSLLGMLPLSAVTVVFSVCPSFPQHEEFPGMRKFRGSFLPHALVEHDKHRNASEFQLRLFNDLAWSNQK